MTTLLKSMPRIFLVYCVYTDEAIFLILYNKDYYFKLKFYSSELNF